MTVSVRKPHRLEHVKFVRKVLKTGVVWYAFFDTGQRVDGKPVYSPMPKWGSVGFFDSYAAHKAHRTRRQVVAYTVAHLANDYLRSPEYARKAPATQKLYRNQLFKIIDLFGEFPPNDLAQSDVRLAMGGADWNPGTYNTVLAVLGVLFKWARRNGRAEVDPVKDIERLKGGQHQPWPEELIEAALVSDDPTVRLAVHLLYFTGQRIGDVCKMRWSDIRKNRVYVRQTKTGKVVVPPLIPELRTELERTPKAGLFIMNGIRERQLRKVLQAFTEAHGVKTVPHGLRKNAVNALLEAGCTIPEVASVTGQTYQVVEHYAARVNTGKLSDAAIAKFDLARRK